MGKWVTVLSGVVLFAGLGVAAAAEWNDYVRRGDQYFHAHDYQSAVEQFDAAATRFPDEPIPKLAKGHALFAMQRYAEASMSLQAGIGLLPQWSRSGIDLRGFFTDPSEFDATMDDLARRLTAQPDDPDLLFLLAYCLHFSSRQDQAQALFRLLLTDIPDHSAALTFIASAPA